MNLDEYRELDNQYIFLTLTLGSKKKILDEAIERIEYLDRRNEQMERALQLVAARLDPDAMDLRVRRAVLTALRADSDHDGRESESRKASSQEED